jgi:hypothetical protein
MIALVFQLALQAAPPLAAPSPLRDQLGNEDSLARHRGRTVLALVVSAKRLRALKGFELELAKRLPAADFLRVADVPRQPPVSHERVAGKLRERVPSQVAIGIDLEGAWAARYGLDTSEVNVLVFDAHGELAARFRGRRSPALVDAIVAAVERLPGAPAGEAP